MGLVDGVTSAVGDGVAPAIGVIVTVACGVCETPGAGVPAGVTVTAAVGVGVAPTVDAGVGVTADVDDGVGVTSAVCVGDCVGVMLIVGVGVIHSVISDSEKPTYNCTPILIPLSSRISGSLKLYCSNTSKILVWYGFMSLKYVINDWIGVESPESLLPVIAIYMPLVYTTYLYWHVRSVILVISVY